ncbi:hypothetical protein GCM10022224_102740 [Nonomuraea antimicrobica]|uniref:STAS domain-containing protein n=1 Tax=Nonomuraea antimicrobica TaxID=561173 RepID=A0ABP7EMV4_9ACTN
MWRHIRRGDKYVTVIIDLTGIRDGTGPVRLLDMVEGRSKQALFDGHLVMIAGPGERHHPFVVSQLGPRCGSTANPPA